MYVCLFWCARSVCLFVQCVIEFGHALTLDISFHIFTFDSLLDLIIASDNMHDTLTADELALCVRQIENIMYANNVFT